MEDILPPEVLSQIQRHVRGRCRTAQSGYENTRHSEDSTTGALGERLRTVRSQGRKLWIDNEEWRWHISFKKLRGEGPNAAEEEVGADGLIQIEIEDKRTKEMWRKGFLFQAKNRRKGSRQKLEEQLREMEELTPGGSLLVNYTADGYEAIRSADFLKDGASWTALDDTRLLPLGDLLADQFLPCKFGVRGLYYDAHRQLILVPSKSQIRSKRYPVEYRISIDVSRGILSDL